MKRYTTIFFIVLISACTNSANKNTVTDIDGNTYTTVTIGKQVWMAENLRVTHFRNGDAIAAIPDAGNWSKATAAAYCEYNNDTSHVTAYGRLYNWHALTDKRSIAPAGWHVPSQEELNTLINYAGGDTVAAGKLKATGTTYWLHSNTGASDQYQFNARAGGYRFGNDGAFHTLLSNGYWWLSNGSYEMYDWTGRLYSGFADVRRDKRYEQYGLAIRCIKDQPAATD